MASFYAAPSYQSGGSFPIYRGTRRHRGGKFFSSVRNFIAPIGRQAFSGIKRGFKHLAQNSVVRNIASEAAKRGTEMLANVAVDALQGRNVGEAFKERSREAALKAIVGESAEDQFPVKPVRAKPSLTSASNTSIRGPSAIKQRKRLAPLSSYSERPLAKRRRKILSRAALNRKDLF